MDKLTFKEYLSLNFKHAWKLGWFDIFRYVFLFVGISFCETPFLAIESLSYLTDSVCPIAIYITCFVFIAIGFGMIVLSEYFGYRYVNKLIELKGKNTNETEDT